MDVQLEALVNGDVGFSPIADGQIGPLAERGLYIAGCSPTIPVCRTLRQIAKVTF